MGKVDRGLSRETDGVFAGSKKDPHPSRAEDGARHLPHPSGGEG